MMANDVYATQVVLLLNLHNITCESLYVEANEESLYRRRERLSLQY